jgi:acetylornithine/N-succinyldiaminopimelate aminotransferase
MTGFEAIKTKDKAYVAGTYGRFPVALARGKNATCWDVDGREYIDFTSGIGVNALGFADEGWAGAVKAQLAVLQHACNLFYTQPCADLAEALCLSSGMGKVFFANSGAEANECAIKAARKYSFDKYGEGRSDIVTLENSFHGRTITTLSATGQDSFHRFFMPFTQGFIHAQPNWTDTLDKLAPSVCAIMLEMVQGEGGVLPLDAAYVREVAQYCAQRDILMIVDEVQTGIGRTGTLFACESYGISPDIITCAKGLGGGLPIGAALFSPKVEGVLGPGDHGSTFGGNPVACAGAVEVLKRLDEGLLAEVREKGAYLAAQLKKLPGVKAVTGLGLMLGIELEGPTAQQVVAAGIEKGVLALTAKKKLRLLPPLTITYPEIDRGIAALAEAICSI